MYARLTCSVVVRTGHVTLNLTADTRICYNQPSLMLQTLQACPRAVGQVDTSKRQRLYQSGCYNVHPATLDAMTHTAGALQSMRGSEQGVMRVPVAISTFLPPSEISKRPTLQPANQYCHGQFTGLMADGSALSDFSLAVLDTNLFLHGFQAKKVVYGAKEVVGHSSELRRLKETDGYPELYAVCYQAAHLQCFVGTPMSASAKGLWSASRSGDVLSAVFRASQARNGAHVARGLLSGVSLLQQHLLSKHDAEVQFVTAGAPSVLPSCADCRKGAAASAAATAALCSLLKVASMEFPAATIKTINQDNRESAALTDVVPGEDASGAAVAGAVHLQAKLLCQQSGSGLKHDTHIMPVPRGSLNNLKMVSVEQADVRTGDVKVIPDHPHPSTLHWCSLLMSFEHGMHNRDCRCRSVLLDLTSEMF